jgi:hypothetical protein
MKRLLLAVFLGFIVLAPTYVWVYSAGMSDGVARYKRSPQFELTLKSMYMFGIMDACEHRELCGR